MNILSLFDGISCGRVALDRVGIHVNKYYASEIDKTAIKISQSNHKDINLVGDVHNLHSWSLPRIDLLLGGSPCQNFSRGATLSNKKRTGLKGDRSNLFWKFLEAKHKFNPKYFLLENVVMPKEHEEIITMSLGVEPIKINSKLVSFQNRERLYWTNIPNVCSPENKNISFQSYFDGFCRFLTRRELELAQTLPVGYTNCVSYNQACKVLGNGWTVDVIAHILGHLK